MRNKLSKLSDERLKELSDIYEYRAKIQGTLKAEGEYIETRSALQELLELRKIKFMMLYKKVVLELGDENAKLKDEIKKLKASQPKFQIGQKVWCCVKDGAYKPFYPMRVVINAIKLYNGGTDYCTDTHDCYVPEKILYSTKALAQVECDRRNKK